MRLLCITGFDLSGRQSSAPNQDSDENQEKSQVPFLFPLYVLPLAILFDYKPTILYSMSNTYDQILTLRYLFYEIL